MDTVINYLKNFRKRNYITSTCKFEYAFVGIGNHSINNLYPIINYLRAHLKYIVTQSNKNAELISNNFQFSEGTTDLQKVLDDKEIQGVFVCANPSSHFKLVKQILGANKHVFVEKPPCLTYAELQELIECEKNSTGQCFVGLQKQYAPAHIELKKKIKGVCYYNYRFVTGAYPEGDPFLDLFIHPLALISFLFGKAELKYIANNASTNGTTTFLHIQHANGSNGIIELSTDYSWTDATELLIVNTKSGIFEVSNTEHLRFTAKQGTILTLPKEKIFGGTMTSTTLTKRNNFNPVFENNQLYTSGYFGEVKNFIQACENKKYSNNATLHDCLNVYEILSAIKKN